MKNTRPTDLKRRGFLLAAGTGSAAAVGVVVVNTRAVPVAAQAKTAAQPASGYQESSHIRDYYATARV